MQTTASRERPVDFLDAYAVLHKPAAQAGENVASGIDALERRVNRFNISALQGADRKGAYGDIVRSGNAGAVLSVFFEVNDAGSRDRPV